MKEFLRSGALLLGTTAGVHWFYVEVIRPRAAAAIDAARLAGQSAPREWAVILKDWEQEICLILMIFCAVQILIKMWALWSENYLFGVDLFQGLEEGVVPSAETLEQTEADNQVSGTQLMQTLKASLRRYWITADVQNTSDAIQASVATLGMRLEADNAMTRYIIWAIPSIGFVGTVRGIGQALSQADVALAGDIAGMTASLGTAFNSTLVALLASLLLMLLLHALQQAQDRRLVDIQAYCEEVLLKRISRPGASAARPAAAGQSPP